MPMILDDLPPQVRPARCPCPPASVHLLTGDSWAPAICTLIEHVTTRIEIAAYSVSTRWPKLASDRFNVYRALLAAPARGVTCSCILAEHKKTAATARFNFWSAHEMAARGWNVRRAPRGRLLHAKMFIFDRRVVVLGSHNIAHAASASNIDLSVCLDGAGSNVSLCHWFDDVWRRSA